MPTPRRRLPAAVATAALAAALGLSLVPQAQATTAAHTSAAAPAPQTAGTASGFLFYVQPTPEVPAAGCVFPVGLNASADAAIDRAACAFAEFTVAGTTGAIT